VKTEQELLVAVRVVDQHGLVTVVRITPAGNAFFRRRVDLVEDHAEAPVDVLDLVAPLGGPLFLGRSPVALGPHADLS
jgi:hypothetical protein